MSLNIILGPSLKEINRGTSDISACTDEQNGLAAILDRIVKTIDVQMHAIAYYPCTKFERNQPKNI